MKNLLTKKSPNRKQAGLLDILASFKIREINLVCGKIHMLGESFSRIPDFLSIHTLQCSPPSLLDLRDVVYRYESDQQFGPIFAALHGQRPEYPKHRRRLEELVPFFSSHDGQLFYKGKLCVPSHARKSVLELAHDPKPAGHFAFSKTLARLAELPWKHKTKHVR